ncbi:MAG: acyl-CoA thioesterase [Phycisphaerales bacterium]|nr:acyl-CoA thioesterase [Phycisphaerales bacterium]
MTTPATTTHVTELRVRYVECDPMGLAHHSAFAVWFEMGRTELLRASGGDYRACEEAGVYLAVVNLEITYKRPARYDDVLRLDTTLDSMTHVKIIHTYRLCRDDVVVATGRSVLACLDSRGRATPIPDCIRHPGT